MKERILIVDNRGRGHALGWKLKVADGSRELFFAPGNFGTSRLGANVDIDVTEIDRLERFASDNQMTLTVVGPEVPLEKGIANAFREDGLDIFAPTKEAAILETSKSEAIRFMQRHNIPHPESRIFDDINEALSFVENPTWAEIVVKACGLAAGKGVILPDSLEEAKQAVKRIMIDKEFDDGKEVVIQKRLRGKEVSLICITDGRTIVPLVPVRDYKRLKDGDKGENTGSMGCNSQALLLTPDLLRNIETDIFNKAISGLRREERAYKGVLYLGGMVIREGGRKRPYVIEFNARWGDPEAQAIVPGIVNDFFEVGMAIANGDIRNLQLQTDGKSRVVVAGVSKGYPGNYEAARGKQIYGINEARKVKGVRFYSAAVKEDRGRHYTNGGRLFYIVGEGKDVIEAQEKAYEAMRFITIEGNNLHFRTDIGWRDVQRL